MGEDRHADPLGDLNSGTPCNRHSPHIQTYAYFFRIGLGATLNYPTDVHLEHSISRVAVR